MGNHSKFTELDFQAGCINEIDGELFTFEREMPGASKLFMHGKTGASYQFIDENTGETRLPTPGDIEYLLAKGRLKPVFMKPARNLNVPVDLDVDVEAIAQMDKAAKSRQVILKLVDEHQPALSDTRLNDFLENHKDEILGAGVAKLPSATSVRRWVKSRGAHADRPLSAMVNMSGRVPRTRSFDPRTEIKLEAEITRFWMELGRTTKDVIDEVTKFVTNYNNSASTQGMLKRPSDETIRLRLRKSETGLLYKQKYGNKAFRQKYRTPHDRRLSATEILETAIVDHTVVDTMLVLSAKHRAPLGRPTLALMVDVASRAILAHFVTFDRPSMYTATQLLKRAVRPKPHLRERFPEFPDGAGIFGLPVSIVYDRAVETIGVSHRDAMADIGVELIFAGAAEPQAKGIVERTFKRFNDLLFHRLSGSVRLPASLMRDMGYDPADTAVITIEELEELLEEAVNVYNYEIHSATDMSPAHYWTSQKTKVRTLPDPAVLDKMAGITVMRTLARNGVRLNHLDYCCEKNVPILLDGMAARQRTQRGKRKGSATASVKVKFNPEDISRIYVFNDADNTYYELRCIDKAYAEGTSLWQHEQIRKYALANSNSFRTEDQRRSARLALARSIEEACPEIGLKAKRAYRRFHDAFVENAEPDEMICLDAYVGAHLAIEVAPAADSRADAGQPQHSPQRGKTARKRNASKSKSTGGGSPRLGKVGTTDLIIVDDHYRAAADAAWADL